MTLNEFKLRYHVQPLPPCPLFKTDSPLIPAAVLLALQSIDNELHLIFTRRPTHLRAHPGQVSFPGGKVDASDPNRVATALREAEEEIGIKSTNLDIIGQLPTQPTFTGFEITPVIALVKAPFMPKINPGEVEEYFTVPLSYLLKKKHRKMQSFSKKGYTYPVYFIPFKQHLIWGATAAITELLCRQLCP